jgi:hypothetical protein
MMGSVMIKDRAEHRGIASIDLSDDELDGLSGGIPHFQNAFAGALAVGQTLPPLPVLQDRPTEDPYAWF